MGSKTNTINKKKAADNPKTLHSMNILNIQSPFALECGEILPELDIAYHTYGTMNADGSNVIWVCHALTGSSDAADWWAGLIGQGKFFNPDEDFIVCANIIGSHYGSTSPLSIDPRTERFYGYNFPVITVRDVAKAHHLLAQYLGIQRIKLCVGGSMGGQQALEWAIQEPYFFEQIAVIACGPKMMPWAIALNETQRMAIEADPSVSAENVATITDLKILQSVGAKGMEAARAIGMLSYRSYEGYNIAQLDDNDFIDTFKVQSYQRYQGQKLRTRFNALSYLSVSKTMDSHNVGRNRGGLTKALEQIKADTLIVGIQSDILFPIEEQAALAAYIPKSRFEVINSKFGHDGFLIEFDQLLSLFEKFTGRKSLR
ncbi:MAG: homoserine O-acetyltransferase [Saprospiraceae bacterium]|nr:homoserine O-acetyltransferase [Saprospiraceae bacterium]